MYKHVHSDRCWHEPQCWWWHKTHMDMHCIDKQSRLSFCVLCEYVIHYVQNVRLYGKSHISLLVRLFSFWLSAVLTSTSGCGVMWIFFFFFSSISCLWRFRRRCCLFLFLLLLSLLFKWVFFSKFRSNQQRRWIYRGARSFIWRWTRKILWISYKTNRFVGFSEMIRARPFRLDNSRRFGWKQSMQCMSVIVVFCALCRSSVRTQCKWHNPTLISAAMASETRRGESCSHSQTQQHARHRLLGIETMQFIQSVWGRFWKFVRVSQCHRAGNGLVSNIQTLTHTHHKFDSCCSVWCDRRILSYRRTQTSRLTTLFFSGLLFTMGGRRGGGGRKKSDTHFALHLQNSLFGFPIPQSLSKSERRLSPKPTTTTMTSTTSDKNGNHFVPGKIKCVLCSWILWKRKI